MGNRATLTDSQMTRNKHRYPRRCEWKKQLIRLLQHLRHVAALVGILVCAARVCVCLYVCVKSRPCTLISRTHKQTQNTHGAANKRTQQIKLKHVRFPAGLSELHRRVDGGYASLQRSFVLVLFNRSRKAIFRLPGTLLMLQMISGGGEICCVDSKALLIYPISKLITDMQLFTARSINGV